VEITDCHHYSEVVLVMGIRGLLPSLVIKIGIDDGPRNIVTNLVAKTLISNDPKRSMTILVTKMTLMVLFLGTL
jgi:hypothetical protein